MIHLAVIPVQSTVVAVVTCVLLLIWREKAHNRHVIFPDRVPPSPAIGREILGVDLVGNIALAYK